MDDDLIISFDFRKVIYDFCTGPIEGISNVLQSLKNLGYKILLIEPVGYPWIKVSMDVYGIYCDDVVCKAPEGCLYISTESDLFNTDPQIMLSNILNYINRG